MIDGRRAARIAGPLGFALALALGGSGAEVGLTRDGLVVAGAGFWMALWWITEAAPIGATSLLPLVLFPLTGAVAMKEVARPYMHPFIVLLMAGFMAALAIERTGLHRRVALRVLLAVGTSPRRLVLGMMLATALCSMWISNTATTLMMLPIGVALVHEAERRSEGDPAATRAFAMALFLGIAYASSIGGLVTPIGTPPNLIFLGVYARSFPDRPPISFLTWMLWVAPVAAVLLALTWLWLTRVAHRVSAGLATGGRQILRGELTAMGPADRDQKAVGAIFALMALLWVTRNLTLGDGGSWGWAPLLGVERTADDATVAVLGLMLLLVLPSRRHPGEALLDWDTARRIPWEVVLLFGGGVSLAEAFQSSGLSAAIAGGLTGLSALPPLLLIGAICLVVTFLTEITSNTATATILMPVLASFAMASGLAPEAIMIPAVLSASCAFMLPVATAPNAIVYGSGHVPIAEMARTGLAINLFGAALITVWAVLLF
ncbi:MAG: SLC13/DASS family transporter [Deltaproteobacteria bacterium]|nr:SLC13/DASS family transporter [Deltaproteobacteria bacterium]MCB9788327.1 SLC13/DASS family transporter [Deltaproteobacteria bacterium]